MDASCTHFGKKNLSRPKFIYCSWMLSLAAVCAASGDVEPATLWMAADNATIYLGSARQAAIRLQQEVVAIEAARGLTLNSDSPRRSRGWR